MPDHDSSLQIHSNLPLVKSIDFDGDADSLFERLEGLPGRVWLDSATANWGANSDDSADNESPVRALSRYSFISADPVLRLIAFPDDPDPWPLLAQLAKSIRTSSAPGLPPFQGGLLGVVGYEASRWLEPHELANCFSSQQNDLPTPAISFGVYDWTIAIDHHRKTAWLISQGLCDANGSQHGSLCQFNTTLRFDLDLARRRIEQVLSLISSKNKPTGTFRFDKAESTPGYLVQRNENLHRESIGADLGFDGDFVQSNLTSKQLREAIANIVQRIHAGDSFQVNLAQRLTADQPISASQLYQRLRRINPAPFAGFYDGGDFQVVSSSPEGFLQLRDQKITTRPIKGTAPRTGDERKDGEYAERLSASEKDRAENIMIVDLMRNDLSRICDDETVRATKICQIESYQYVQHLVSVVEGRLRGGCDAVDALMACFPGGSVTGAPKIEAMKTIAELEPHPRGPYCGSMGYLSCSGDADFNILIRTITAAHGKLQIPVGGGITARSVPADEEAETWDKALGMLKALPPSRVQATIRTG